MSKEIFSDGSFVEFMDRDTVKYVKKGRVIYISLDVDGILGLFTNTRVIKKSLLKTWENHDEIIDFDKKEEIVEKVKKWCKRNWRRLRVEE